MRSASQIFNLFFASTPKKRCQKIKEITAVERTKKSSPQIALCSTRKIEIVEQNSLSIGSRSVVALCFLKINVNESTATDQEQVVVLGWRISSYSWRNIKNHNAVPSDDFISFSSQHVKWNERKNFMKYALTIGDDLFDNEKHGAEYKTRFISPKFIEFSVFGNRIHDRPKKCASDVNGVDGAICPPKHWTVNGRLSPVDRGQKSTKTLFFCVCRACSQSFRSQKNYQIGWSLVV